MKFSHEDAPITDPDLVPTPEDPEALLAHIAKLLGVEDPSDYDDIDEALDRLIATVAGDDGEDADDGGDLTESERKACRLQGCSFASFRAVKQLHKPSSVQARLRRQDAVTGIRRFR
jgi:hypothetical protein